MNDAMLLAGMAAAGADPSFIETTRNNPQAMELLRQTLADLPAPFGNASAPVASEDPIKELDETMKRVQERYEEDQRMTPYKVPALNREQMQLAQRYEHQQSNAMETAGQFVQLQTFCGIPKSFSSVSDLGSLQRVFLKDMHIPKTHKGQYLLCRTISQPILKVGLTVIVEDQLGRIEQLGLYNLPLGNMITSVELDTFIPLGSVVAVKEPTYKRAAVGGSNLIRADSPTDVVFLTPFDPIARDAKWKTLSPARPVKNRDYKAEGNAHFAKRQYRHADKVYSEGIAAAPASDILLLLHLNRAAARPYIDQPRGAHRDALAVLSMLESNAELGTPSSKEKALVRRARAEEDMRLNEEALVSYDAALKHAPNNEQAVEGKQRVERKLAESRPGDYDWVGIFKAGLDVEKNPRQDVGDFVGPVRISKAEGRGGGRGVFASRAIKAGELLLVEKAFAIEYPEPRRIVMSMNLITKQADLGAHTATVASVMAKLMDDGTLDQIVHSLYAGPLHGAPLDVPEQPYSNLVEDKNVCIDPAKIEDICTYNGFGSGGRGTGKATLARQVETSAEETNAMSPSCLLTRGSLFNHSCVPNAGWQTYSDIFVVRAGAGIAEGAEIFIPYTLEGLESFSRDKDTSALAKHFPSSGCSCELCAAERRDGPARAARRKKLMEDVDELTSLVHQLPSSPLRCPATIGRLKKFLADVEATYSAGRRCEIKMASAEAHHLLAEAYTIQGHLADAISHTLKSFEARGGVIRPSPLDTRRSTERPAVLAAPAGDVDGAVKHLIVNARRSAAMGKASKAREWLRLAMECEEIYNGGGKEKFGLRFEEVLQALELERVFESM